VSLQAFFSCAAQYYPTMMKKSNQFAVVYHLHNWYENKRIKVKAYINGENPEIKSISNIEFQLMEREIMIFME
jgi:NADH-quinone oxidoreductase subunit C